MLQKPFFGLILFLFFYTNSFGGPIIALDEAIADTTCITVESKLDNVLNSHPLLTPLVSSEKKPYKPRIVENKTGLFFFSVMLLFIFSLARLIFPRYFFNLFQIFSNLSFSKRHIKDQLENDNRASLWFYIIYCISIGFIVYEYFSRNSKSLFSEKWYVNYAVCTLFVILLLSLRTGMLRLIGWIFKSSDYVKQYLFNSKLVSEFLGLLLFPLSILILLSTGKIQSALLLFAGALFFILIIYSYLRNILALRNLFRVSFVHFLLYLCAFEVIPVLILVKMLS